MLADLYLSAVLFGVSQVLLRKELIVTMQKVRVTDKESGSRQSQSAVNLLTSGLSKLNLSGPSQRRLEREHKCPQAENLSDLLQDC